MEGEYLKGNYIVVTPSVTHPSDPVRLFTSKHHLFEYVQANGLMFNANEGTMIQRVHTFETKEEAIKFFNESVNEQFYRLHKDISDLMEHYRKLYFTNLDMIASF